MSRHQNNGGRVAVLAVFVGIAATAINGCTLPHQSDIAPAVPTAAAPEQLAQLRFGGQATFARCTPPACPTLTRKTRPGSHAMQKPAGLPPASPAATPSPRLAASPTTAHFTVQFPFGSAALTTEAKQGLGKIVDRAKDAREIAVAGRTDSAGPLALNQRLAQARATAVRDYLRQRLPHIAQQIRATGEGRCCYAAPNDTDAGRARNRRVEIDLRFSSEAGP